MSVVMNLQLCALFFSILGHALAAEILVVHPLPAYSHTVPFKTIFKELARRGHNITIITAFVENPAPKGFTQIGYNLNIKLMKEELVTLNPVKDCNGWLYEMQGMWPTCKMFTPLLNRHLKPLLPPKSQKFDLIIMEPFFCQEFILGLSHYYNASVVATLPQPLTSAIAAALGNPEYSSYIPNMRLTLTPYMSFTERVYNTFVNLFEWIGNHIYYLPYQDKQMRELLDDPDIPYVGELLKNVVLVLSQTHFSMNYPRPVMKNVLEVGGISLDVKKTLPEDLEKWMKEASDGVVYFSWGSHYEETESVILPALMDTFSRLKERVIFKWHDLNIPNKPENVLVKTWVPQTALLSEKLANRLYLGGTHILFSQTRYPGFHLDLRFTWKEHIRFKRQVLNRQYGQLYSLLRGHRNLRVFISHCGLNSVYEAAYHGVPMVATPLFGDQPYNSKLVEYFGMGVMVQPEQLTDRVTLLAAINRVLNDPSFRANAEKRGRMLKDRAVPAAEEAAYWIEYILKYGGDALKPPSASMPWYKLSLFDVYAFFFGLAFLPILSIAVCIRSCLRKRPSKIVDIKKKKK